MLKLSQYDDTYMYFATSKKHLKLNSCKKKINSEAELKKSVAYKNYVNSKLS